MSAQILYMALTFIVFVIIVLTAQSFSDALMMISLLSQFLIVSTLLTSVHESTDATDLAATNVTWLPARGSFEPDREGFTGRPLITPGTGISADAGRGAAVYPGGLHDIQSLVHDYGAVGPAGTGAVYSPMQAAATPSGADRPREASVGPMRSFETRPAPAPCDYGYAAESRNTFDADRQMVEHGRWRNDPHRVVAGVMRRKEAIDRYVREELDEKEHEPWWGRWDL